MKKNIKKEKLGFHIVLLGQIAAGKDTQALFLLEKYNFIPVESGKYWRKKEKEKSAEGDLARRTVSLGKPAPVALMKKFLISQIENCPKGKNLLFVGNPRLKPEGQLLKKLLTERKENFFVLYITLPEKEIYKRSFGRSRGSDDSRAFIYNRIKWHKDQVSRTIEYFESLGKVKRIKGNQKILEVASDIEGVIQSFKIK